MSRTSPPFAERGGPVRGLLDLATGCYPAFLFGGGLANLLPVFHLHHADPAVLGPQLAYLAENGYRTVTTDAIVRVAIEGKTPEPRTVALCFDDCWSSLWTVAGPLLRAHGMSAVAFAIPARIHDAQSPRPTIDEDRGAALAADTSIRPFASWAELQHSHSAGVLDIQSHTLSHSSIFAGPEVTGFVTPDFATEPLLDRPAIGDRQWLSPDALGAPLYPQRSRMSDAQRFYDDEGVRERCTRHVAASGGPEFFRRASWREELNAIASTAKGHTETETDRRRAIDRELGEAREILEHRLGAPAPHVCLPWGIGGAETRDALRRTGQKLAFADRLFGRRAVAPGDDPHSLMRLHERFIFCLPGRGRRTFFTTR